MACTGAAAGTGIMSDISSKPDPTIAPPRMSLHSLDNSGGNKFDAHNRMS